MVVRTRMVASRGSTTAATELRPDHDDAAHEDARDDEGAAVGWQWSYDQASIERFMDEVEAERTRLQAEIHAANERLAEAEAASTSAQSAASASTREAVEAELGAIVLAAHQELAAIEREHLHAITTIREDAVADAARVLAAAHEQATAIRERAARLATESDSTP